MPCTGKCWLTARAFTLCEVTTVGAPLASCSPSAALEEVTRHETAWRASNVRDYNVDFQRDCLGIVCDVGATRPVRIHVRNAGIVMVSDGLGVQVAPKDGVSWPSVDSMYVWIRQVLSGREYSIEIVFDTLLHMPIYMRTDDQRSASVANYFWNLDTLLSDTSAAVARSNYWMGAPLSKSKRVTWRSR